MVVFLLAVLEQLINSRQLVGVESEHQKGTDYNSLSRVVLRHVLKVSDQGEQSRKDDEAAAKQSSKGKKKSAKKVKPRRLVEELDVQAIMLNLFQVHPHSYFMLRSNMHDKSCFVLQRLCSYICPTYRLLFLPAHSVLQHRCVQELLPSDCSLPMSIDHIHQLPMVKELLGSLPPLPITEQTAPSDAPESQTTPPASTNAGEHDSNFPRPQSAPPAVISPTVSPVLEATPPSIELPPPVSTTAPTSAPCGLRKLPPRSKKVSATNSAGAPVLAPTSDASLTTGTFSAQPQPASGSFSVHGAEPCKKQTQATFRIGQTRIRCTSADELITTWPAQVWCPAPSAEQIKALLQALSAAVSDYQGSLPSDSKALVHVAQAAQEVAAKCGLSDEALMYTLTTLSAPGCQQASHELIWNSDARFRACALRLPVPNFTLSSASSLSDNSWVLPHTPVDAVELLIRAVVDGTAGAEESSTVHPGAAFMDPQPHEFDVEHPKMQAWTDRVAADIVSRRTKECESIKVSFFSSQQVNVSAYCCSCNV